MCSLVSSEIKIRTRTSDMAEPVNSEDTSARGQWHWNARSMKLSLSPDPAGSLSDLSGEWSLSAFGMKLDGLSMSRLDQTLKALDGPVSCELGLADGRQFSLVGAFTEPGSAQGMLLSGDKERRHGEKDADSSIGPELTPVYQPIISLADGRIAGFEALARWSDAGQKRPPAKRFEDPALASNMLIKAANELAMWREKTRRSDLFVHVNLTGRDLADGQVTGLIEALVSGHKLTNGSLRIELTEQAALRDFDEAIKVTRAIKKAGAGLVLDDFGSGHSSFLWLADMPADSLKIDPELTRRIGDERTDTILEAITLLASRLKMTVTGEGVEQKSDAAKLRSLGFQYVQGFAFGRPMLADAVLDFLKTK